ncbi:unnamed protein product [Darwinula stevensoni]|uniref:Secreted protein n=1 Tax=Darwinula stevensoni TaxID=69355 RepID=A0A7R9AH27_9CRUS|nr:unnamed protein product [Darwinula stevensoni]CAG0905188.1 unnamed protein product [Darwinula stevensoni]
MVRRSRFGTVAAVVILLCLLVSQPSDAKRRGKGKKNQQQPEEKPRLEVENDSPQIVQELPSSEGVGEEPKEQETESGDEDSNGIRGRTNDCIPGNKSITSLVILRIRGVAR